MLTNREKEVLKYICMGYTNEEISKALIISSHTTKAHVKAILKKFNLKNRTIAAYFAGKNHLVNLDSNIK